MVVVGATVVVVVGATVVVVVGATVVVVVGATVVVVVGATVVVVARGIRRTTPRRAPTVTELTIWLSASRYWRPRLTVIAVEGEAFATTAPLAKSRRRTLAPSEYDPPLAAPRFQSNSGAHRVLSVPNSDRPSEARRKLAKP